MVSTRQMTSLVTGRNNRCNDATSTKDTTAEVAATKVIEEQTAAEQTIAEHAFSEAEIAAAKANNGHNDCESLPTGEPAENLKEGLFFDINDTIEGEDILCQNESQPQQSKTAQSCLNFLTLMCWRMAILLPSQLNDDKLNSY